MVQQIVNALVPVIITAIVGVLVAAIKSIGDAGIAYFNEKAAAVKAKAGQEKWEHWMNLGRQAWNITEENTRIVPTLEKTIAAKQAEFAVQIKRLIPGITDEQIEQIRQAIAGEVNKGKAAIEVATSDVQNNGNVKPA